MSDRVTNVEIEDVLSSIRRLVSTDVRPVKPQEETDAAAGGAEREKLVLTQSLRVDGAASAPAALRLRAADQLASSDDVDDRAGHDAPDRATPPGVAADRSDALKARVAELEEVVSRQAGQWEPDGASADENSGGPVAPLPWEDDGPDDDSAQDDDDSRQVIEDAIADAAKDAAQPGAASASGDESAGARTGAENNELPEKIGAPDGASRDRTGAGRSKAADAKAAEAGAPRDADEAGLLAGGEDVLDEDALRDLVADIVRQELQGALGERITRNVRKLVRREIYRALASQDFE